MRSLLLTALAAAALGAGVLGGCGGDDDDDLFGSTGANSSTGSGSGTGGGISPDDPVKPAAGGLRRLMKPQYVGSVRVLFGDVGAAQAVPPQDQALKGYDAVGATELTTSSNGVDQYEQSARAIATAVLADPTTRAAILPCEPTTVDDTACIAQFVSELGRVAWRRPLVQAEIDRIVAAAQTSGNAFFSTDAALEAVISALLQSFYFLYIVEIGEPDAADPTVRRLTPTELVTRMSFFLLNQTPDAALLDAAESGQLDDEAGIKAIAKQMLARPEAKTTLDTIFSETLRLREIDIMEKDATKFPQFDPALKDALKASMKEETLQLLRSLVWDQNTDARAMLTADYTFVDQTLAGFYGVTPPASGWAKVTLPASQGRHGVLGHAGLLALLSHIDSTSPTRRGAFIQARLLCTPVPPPPPGVNPVLPPDDGTPKPIKEKLLQHMTDPSCKSCHGDMDTLGFALEHFDGVGAWRETENGFPIDTASTSPTLGDFADAGELAQLVSDDPRSTACTIKHFFRHSMGHLETDGEAPALLKLGESYDASGYKIQDLLVELTASDAFRLVADPK